ncbi:MAG: hypothetical protein J6Q59_08370, partial [Paludibacteraceae bacterium]|nr:hypothetical protein [Paludibacteraceae bacterium]
MLATDIILPLILTFASFSSWIKTTDITEKYKAIGKRAISKITKWLEKSPKTSTTPLHDKKRNGIKRKGLKPIEEETLKAAAELSPRLSLVSRERVFAELEK